METVLITGATSGIGRAFAGHYAARGCRLLLAGRDPEKLERLAAELKTECRLLTADLADEAQVRQLAETLRGEPVDVFINNAGFGVTGPFTETDAEKETAMLKVNDLAMHLLFKSILRGMQARGRGTIVNVASSAGLLPGGPYMAAYYASKAYAASLTKAVARELKEAGSNVYVCALCPGPVDTNFNRNADASFSLKGISAEECVKACLAGMARKKTVIVPTARMRAAVFSRRILPEKVMLAVTGRQQKKKIRPK